MGYVECGINSANKPDKGSSAAKVKFHTFAVFGNYEIKVL